MYINKTHKTLTSHSCVQLHNSTREGRDVKRIIGGIRKIEVAPQEISHSGFSERSHLLAGEGTTTFPVPRVIVLEPEAIGVTCLLESQSDDEASGVPKTGTGVMRLCQESDNPVDVVHLRVELLKVLGQGLIIRHEDLEAFEWVDK